MQNEDKNTDRISWIARKIFNTTKEPVRIENLMELYP